MRAVGPYHYGRIKGRSIDARAAGHGAPDLRNGGEFLHDRGIAALPHADHCSAYIDSRSSHGRTQRQESVVHLQRASGSYQTPEPLRRLLGLSRQRRHTKWCAGVGAPMRRRLPVAVRALTVWTQAVSSSADGFLTNPAVSSAIWAAAFLPDR